MFYCHQIIIKSFKKFYFLYVHICRQMLQSICSYICKCTALLHLFSSMHFAVSITMFETFISKQVSKRDASLSGLWTSLLAVIKFHNKKLLNGLVLPGFVCFQHNSTERNLICLHVFKGLTQWQRKKKHPQKIFNLSARQSFKSRS